MPADPHPSLAQVLRALPQGAGVGVFECGHTGTLVTWSHGAPVRCTAPRGHGATDAAWVTEARRALGPRTAADAPFAGGLFGWIGYEAGACFERMPPPAGPRALADVSLWRGEGGLWRTGPGAPWRAHGAPAFLAEAQAVLQTAARVPHPTSGEPPAAASLRSEDPDQGPAYRAGVAQLLDAIRRGDVYQVNLAWRVAGPAVTDPIAAWLRVQQGNPATRGALVCAGHQAVLSNSPELYLAATPGPGGALLLESVPIKGTATAAAGAAGRAHLWESEKERAELTMIVDLVRNDLGRVAVAGTVRAGPRALRDCGDLVHAEQSVTATLRPEHDVWDAIAASFPPGSVTGAPKVAAMAHIAGLEPLPRGVYTGAVGWVGDTGAAHFNVAIRTATVIGRESHAHVGAGIVADSEPAREWLETVAKGRALLHLLEDA